MKKSKKRPPYEIEVDISGSYKDVSRRVETAAKDCGLLITLVTTHSSYSGSIHWHFKPQKKIRGILDLTYFAD